MNIELAVNVIFRSNNEFLTIRRSENDLDYPGEWDFPGGHVEKNESVIDGLKREVFEEIGYSLNIKPELINYSDVVYNDNHYLEMNFLIDVNKEDMNINLSDEHSEYKWIKKDYNINNNYITEKLSIL